MTIPHMEPPPDMDALQAENAATKVELARLNAELAALMAAPGEVDQAVWLQLLIDHFRLLARFKALEGQAREGMGRALIQYGETN